MPDRNWGRIDAIGLSAAAAAVFVLLLAFAWMLGRLDASYIDQAKYNAAQYADRAESRISSSCPNREPVAFAKCVKEIIQSTHEAQTSERDLAAQRSMALWAFATFCTSVAGVLVTLVGIWFVQQTLQANREANSINREVGEAQVRAYLIIESIKLALIEMNGIGRVPQLHFKLTNSGNSPARKIGVFARTSAPDVPVVDASMYSGCVFEALRPGGNIIDHIHVARILPEVPAPRTWLAFRRIEIRIHYLDVFNKAIQTELTYLSFVGNGASGTFDVVEADPAMHLHDPWSNKHPYET